LYELEGARLVSYENNYAAYVAYRMQKRPISLLVTSEQIVPPSGSEEIVSKNITFHYDSFGKLMSFASTSNAMIGAL